MSSYKIGRKRIGDNAPCFIIAEVGSNHNGSLAQAKKMVDVAKAAGADAVKFQIYSAETLYSKKVPQHSGYKKHLWELIKEIETPRKWIPELRKYCDKKDIIFFATPFDLQAVDGLDPYVDCYKIASFELVDLDLISYVAKKKKPLIISTGLATMEEMEDVYQVCQKARNSKLVFLQCASLYPSPPENINLRSMETIKQAFGVPVGLSDHTLSIHVSVAAVAMGAKVIEKHFTLDRRMPGPDHPFAIEPQELKQLVEQIRDVEKAFGDGRKHGPLPNEMENYNVARRSIHAKVDIPAGSKVKKDMLIVKRPGYGIKPKLAPMLIGRKAKRNIEQEEWITWDMVGE